MGVEGYRPFPKIQGERGFPCEPKILAHLKPSWFSPGNCHCRGNKAGEGSREMKRDMGDLDR